MALPEFVNQASGSQGNATSHSISFTPGAGVNLVVVALAVGGSISGLSVTYGGVPMTFLNSVSGALYQIYLYYIVNPPAGASTVAANWTTSCVNNLAVCGYKGVNTVNPFGTVATATAGSGAPTVNVTSNPTELVIDAVAGGGSLAVGAGQTQEYNTSTNINSAGSYEPGAATVTMSWSMASAAWSIIAVPVRPQTSFFLMF